MSRVFYDRTWDVTAGRSLSCLYSASTLALMLSQSIFTCITVLTNDDDDCNGDDDDDDDDVPEQWKRSVITPVPKVSRPMSISQFRPISVASRREIGG